MSLNDMSRHFKRFARRVYLQEKRYPTGQWLTPIGLDTESVRSFIEQDRSGFDDREAWLRALSGSPAEEGE